MNGRTAWLIAIVAGPVAIVLAAVLIVTLSTPGSNTAANTSARTPQPESPYSVPAPPSPHSSLADVDLPAGAVFAVNSLTEERWRYTAPPYDDTLRVVPSPGGELLPQERNGGLGGTIGWADPATKSSFAFVHNLLVTPIVLDQILFVPLDLAAAARYRGGARARAPHRAAVWRALPRNGRTKRDDPLNRPRQCLIRAS